MLRGAKPRRNTNYLNMVTLPLLLSLLLCLLGVPTTWSRQQYQYLIPNGNNVGGGAVSAVGHTSSNGGSRNAFGNDFSASGLSYTRAFCQQDSDQDGISNGMELGDPCCEWAQGRSPRYTSDISDPGVASGTYGRPTTRSCRDLNCTNGVNPCTANGSVGRHAALDSRMVVATVAAIFILSAAAILQ